MRARIVDWVHKMICWVSKIDPCPLTIVWLTSYSSLYATDDVTCSLRQRSRLLDI